MTERYLKSLIDKLNKKRTNGLIHLRPLADNIFIAKVWTDKPKPDDRITFPDGPYRIYFITNREGFYVGAVLDMWEDLHWFIDKKHRRQGFLTNAMRETILIHLFQDREEQKITIDRYQIGQHNFKSSEKVALSLGFVRTEEGVYVLQKGNYIAAKPLYGQNIEMSVDRKNELKNYINYIGRSLWMAHSEIEAMFGETEYTKELKKLIEEIKKHSIRFEDAWFDSKKMVTK